MNNFVTVAIVLQRNNHRFTALEKSD